jgi:lipid-binding SYLF domain-containing protein
MNPKKSLLTLVALLLSLTTACMGPKGGSPQEKHTSALAMRDKALAAVYAESPEVKPILETAPGYAVLSNFSIHPGLLSFASGYGLLFNKKAERETHIKWHRLTFGPGIAVKGLYSVVVFHDQELLEKFEEGRWAVGGQAEASLVFGDFGGALDAGWVFNRKVDVHYATHTGVALELELVGLGKVSNDKKLNRSLGQ